MCRFFRVQTPSLKQSFQTAALCNHVVNFVLFLFISAACKTFSGTITIPDRELSALLRNRSTEDFYRMKKDFETTVSYRCIKMWLSAT